MASWNYAEAETNKLDADATRFAVQLRSDGERRGQEHIETTRWLGLSPEQYAQVRELLISFNL